MRGHRLRDDRGAAVVEAALVLPMVLFVLMGLFDFSIIELESAQVTSAARDGARAGIISWRDANAGSYTGGSCPTTPASFGSICRAAVGRLAGTEVTGITVRCRTGNTDVQVACSDANYGQGPLAVVVTVTGVHRPLTPTGQALLGSSRPITATSRMLIP